MIRLKSTGYRSRGFSLIEVMIAVVVLATGLLALAALQGSLTRNSAEAKVRGRVAAMLSARMDELRGTGYGSLVTPSPATTTSKTDPCDGDATDWIDCTRVQASLGSLSVTQTVTAWSGTGTFTATTPTDQDEAQFKRVSLTAVWSDATGDNHQLAAASDVSPLSLTNSLIPPPDDQSSGAGGPIVRTTNPATAGVIPIALGNGDSSAASNPTPELVGRKTNQKIVGTKFNVLTYTPSGDSAVIQKRFENDVIKCSCQYGAGGTNLPVIDQTAQWPAIWTGDRYDVYKPVPAVAAPGQAMNSGPDPAYVDTESPLCRQCCRDHHDDPAATGVVKFDPESPSLKYNPDSIGTLVQVANTSSGTTYVDACRVIRVDGFLRVASDMYSRQFGLLETESQVIAGETKQAKTGLPTTAATDAYTAFVKDYLGQYNGSVGTAPTNAQTKFDGTTGINVPLTVTIRAPSTTDYRYLHGRGLYVDYLEAKALAKLVAVLADTGAGGRCDQTVTTTHPVAKPIADCVLPYLPFTSVNLTEIAAWLASDPAVLKVNSGNLLATNPGQPSGGRTYGRTASPTVPPYVNNTASVRQSNSGVAINTLLGVTIAGVFTPLRGVDPTDNTTVSDHQDFLVGGSSGTGDDFFVHVTGAGLNPYVFYAVGTTDNGECFKPEGSNHDCGTSSTLPLAGSITLSNYWIEDETLARNYSTTCGGVAARDDVLFPTFHNYAATTVTGATGLPPYSVTADGKNIETTTINLTSIIANSTINVGFSETGSTRATIASCTTNAAGEINDIVWTKPWELP